MLACGDTMNKEYLILASKSPRREYLLNQAGLEFAISVSQVDEAAAPWSDPETYTRQLAQAKATDVAASFPDSWVLGADTIVMLGDEVLEKPESVDQARQMLTSLSGIRHTVYTGFAIVCLARNHIYTEVVQTQVWFKKLSPAQINWYLATDEPYDKAGAYAIQGLGASLVKEIKGSYTNVVGLPVCEVMDYLLRHNIFSLGHKGAIEPAEFTTAEAV